MSQSEGPDHQPGSGPPTPPPPDYSAPSAKDPGPATPPNLFVDESGASLWVRALYMILFGCIAYIVLILTFLASALQLIVFLVAGKPNEELRHFGREMLSYLTVMVRFLVFLDDKKPFPFSPFPSAGAPPL